MIVYCHINTIDGKMYVGITDRDIDYRWNKHVISARLGSEYHFHRALRKHGEEVFEGVILEECSSIDELKLAERRWIKLLASNLPVIGYNMTMGGDGIFGHKMSEGSRQKMRDSHLGKRHTEEQKQKIREAMLRRYEDPTERKRTQDSLLRPEIREKMSTSGKGKNLGRVVSEETRQKISESYKRRRLNNE